MDSDGFDCSRAPEENAKSEMKSPMNGARDVSGVEFRPPRVCRLRLHPGLLRAGTSRAPFVGRKNFPALSRGQSAALENHECASQDDDEYGQSEKGGDELEDFRVLKCTGGSLLL
jgi:hypothetical protein